MPGFSPEFMMLQAFQQQGVAIAQAAEQRYSQQWFRQRVHYMKAHQHFLLFIQE
jgi:hypothetical protein